MNPLNTFKKAKAWADKQSDKFSKNGYEARYMVCAWNDGFIVHEIRHIHKHIKEYTVDELIYCTDEDEFKKLIIMIRFAINLKNEVNYRNRKKS